MLESLRAAQPTLPMARSRRGDRGHRGRPRVGRLSQTHRANVSAEDAQSYRTVLATLGGKEFRVGTLEQADRAPARRQRRVVRLAPGTVVGDRARPRVGAVRHGQGRALHRRRRGRHRRSTPARSSSRPTVTPPRWLVTSSDLTAYDRLTITAEDGTVAGHRRHRPPLSGVTISRRIAPRNGAEPVLVRVVALQQVERVASILDRQPDVLGHQHHARGELLPARDRTPSCRGRTCRRS